jgi:hypothetical protein
MVVMKVLIGQDGNQTLTMLMAQVALHSISSKPPSLVQDHIENISSIYSPRSDILWLQLPVRHPKLSVAAWGTNLSDNTALWPTGCQHTTSQRFTAK